jgi:hypothetical protein
MFCNALGRDCVGQSPHEIAGRLAGPVPLNSPARLRFSCATFDANSTPFDYSEAAYVQTLILNDR